MNWQTHLHGKTLRDAVLDTLCRGSITAAYELFNTKENLTPDILREYCLVIISCANELYCSKSADDSVRSDVAARFYALSDSADIKSMCMEEVKSLMMAHSAGRAGHIVDRAKVYIKDNISSPDINSSAVARHFGLTVDHLSRLFKSQGESTLSVYIIEEKISNAKDVLKRTSIPIRSVAQTLGYTDPNYFVRVFKNKTGMTPTQYRNFTDKDTSASGR